METAYALLIGAIVTLAMFGAYARGRGDGLKSGNALIQAYQTQQEELLTTLRQTSITGNVGVDRR